MKLYATTTSERASKGQGGNDKLEIEITGENKLPLAFITVLPSGTIIVEEQEGGEVVVEKTKGKSQKGEYTPRLCKSGRHDNNKYSCVC
jgi:hypothetical protein